MNAVGTIKVINGKEYIWSTAINEHGSWVGVEVASGKVSTGNLLTRGIRKGIIYLFNPILLD